MWLLYSLLAALAESVKDAYGKVSAQKIDEYAAAISLHAFTLLLAIPLVAWFGVPNLTRQFWVGSAAFIIITPLWTILYMKALKWSELSVVVPMLGFVPVITALLGVFFGEKLYAVSWIGIALISAGIYLVNAERALLKTNFFAPIKKLVDDRGAQAMFGVALLWSLGAHLSKMRVEGSSALFSTFTSALIGTCTMALLAKLRGRSLSLAQFKANFAHLAPVGVSYFFAGIFTGLALVGGSTSYVFTTKRSSIIFSALIGMFFFKEKLQELRLLGIVLTLAGVMLLSIA